MAKVVVLDTMIACKHGKHQELVFEGDSGVAFTPCPCYQCYDDEPTLMQYDFCEVCNRDTFLLRERAGRRWQCMCHTVNKAMKWYQTPKEKVVIE